MKKLVANVIKPSETTEEIIKQINNVNNEMAQSINMLLTSLENSQKEIANLKKANDSLNIKLGEFSSSKSGVSIKKKTSAKNIKIGQTDASTVDSDTLYKDSEGNLMWVDSLGVHKPVTS